MLIMTRSNAAVRLLILLALAAVVVLVALHFGSSGTSNVHVGCQILNGARACSLPGAEQLSGIAPEPDLWVAGALLWSFAAVLLLRRNGRTLLDRVPYV
jgi:hypothetical protein